MPLTSYIETSNSIFYETKKQIHINMLNVKYDITLGSQFIMLDFEIWKKLFLIWHSD